MYICEDCGIIAETLTPVSTSHPYGESFTEELLYDAECPHCGGAFVEARVCPICKVTYINADTEFMCSSCLEDNTTYENAKEMGAKVEDKIKINGFWSFVFTSSEIDEILKEAFEELPEELQKKYIKEYCEEDTSYLADFVEERRRKCYST